jgi:hypothetical protein
MSELMQRFVTALLLLPVVIWCVFFAPDASAFAVFAGVIITAGAWEWTRMMGWSSAGVRALYVLLLADGCRSLQSAVSASDTASAVCRECGLLVAGAQMGGRLSRYYGAVGAYRGVGAGGVFAAVAGLVGPDQSACRLALVVDVPFFAGLGRGYRRVLHRRAWVNASWRLRSVPARPSRACWAGLVLAL